VNRAQLHSQSKVSARMWTWCWNGGGGGEVLASEWSANAEQLLSVGPGLVEGGEQVFAGTGPLSRVVEGFGPR
jgi:hypothetical protein